MAISTFAFPLHELHIEHTVICGQTFRWKQDKQGWWSCLLPVTGSPPNVPRHQLVRLWQERESVFYETLPRSNDLKLVRDYFRLDIDLDALTREFARVDPHIQPALSDFPGLRVLRQDPEECLFSFLCTPAAPLHRIRSAITSLCRAYGDSFPGGAVAGVMHHGFPPTQRFAEASIPQMEKFGLGFRAKRIKEAAQQVMANGGAGWLLSLRSLPYPEARAALMTLSGVGEKIADCVCLFSLDKDDAIPVDTHIRQIVQRRYVTAEIRPTLPAGGKKLDQALGDILRERFGAMAGWAQQYLFFGDLYQKGAWDVYVSQTRSTLLDFQGKIEG
ncbi:MAG: hypothetical protein M3Y28_01790 [Armatimonadota bacterium]|nr:hypothetical protein [Armatimonadota bacterium]